MSTFDKFDATRTETVVIGMMMDDRIRIWRDDEPSTWDIKSHSEARELAESLKLGRIGTEAFRDGYYRTVAQLDPESMVACFHTHESLGRYGSKKSHGHFVQLSTPTRRRRDRWQTPAATGHSMQDAVTAASEVSSRRGDLLIVSGYDVDGPALTAGTAFRDGQMLSILSATPQPDSPRWPDKSEPSMLIATLDPHSRHEIGELAGEALSAWQIDPWDVIFTYVSPIEQVSGSLIPMGGRTRDDDPNLDQDVAI